MIIMTNKKKCPDCKRDLPLTDFHRDKIKRDGCATYCKECAKRRVRKWSLENPEKRKEYVRQYEIENREVLKKKRHQYYLDHKEEITEKNEKWKEENYERWLEYQREYHRQWRKDNPEKMAEYGRRASEKMRGKRHEQWRRWVEKNPEKARNNWRKKRIRKANAEGSHTAEEWKALCEKYKYTCLRCGKAVPEIQLTRDHIVPLSVGGTDYINNIQPLCMDCNQWKYTKTIDFRPEVE